MQRGSDKHSPRVDDELTHETRSLIQSGQTETRSDQALVQEGLLPDEQPAAGAPEVHEPAGPGQLGDDEVELRSELARWLEPHILPAAGAAIVASARHRQAPDSIVGLLERLPDGAVHQTVAGVWEAIGGHREQRG